MSRKKFWGIVDRDGGTYNEGDETHHGDGKLRRRFRRYAAACLCTVIVIAAAAFVLKFPAFRDCGAQGGSWFRKHPEAAYIPEHATSVQVEYFHGGESATWTVTGDKLDALRAWLDGLRCHYVIFAEGETPGDSDGGAFYFFTITEGDDSGFSYVMNGGDGNYLLVEGEWYHVDHPSPPPIE